MKRSGLLRSFGFFRFSFSMPAADPFHVFIFHPAASFCRFILRQKGKISTGVPKILILRQISADT
ncbi:MAG: hypothetical protein E7029_00180 [Planctomycetaceae bacterium]|nr:hypothetical protein [Planctomycetaceae bacterium]